MLDHSRTFFFACASMMSVSAYAGGFVSLPNGELGTAAPCLNSVRCNGVNNVNVDPFYITPGAVTGTTTVTVGVGATASQRTVNVHAFPTQFTLLESRQTSFSDNSVVGGFSGVFFDYVFLDNTTDTLVFGSRLQMIDLSEANDIFRSGFADYETEVAWTRVYSSTSGNDLRLYSAARSSVGLKGGADPLPGSEAYDNDVVDLRSDVNQAERNPFSGLYLIRTNATEEQGYSLVDGAAWIRQAGEEGQPVLTRSFAAFAPNPVVAVPEPETYAMLLAGLALTGVVARRRK
ncbi:PEP-CTERM sorting domain-containing protein [Methyloversatilis thermotolerans]|uniref:PEP-CTERM sorting domain-containing protein n=1 Tax=Methyloversatilis thermotolerans TaxID=1346290 RepID=UPI0012FAC327|nr:PEP-CTERM sorting domain-containing protein [Methyloversatilis thermotolerans]